MVLYVQRNPRLIACELYFDDEIIVRDLESVSFFMTSNSIGFVLKGDTAFDMQFIDLNPKDCFYVYSDDFHFAVSLERNGVEERKSSSGE